jgi:hypothetical protein
MQTGAKEESRFFANVELAAAAAGTPNGTIRHGKAVHDRRSYTFAD